MGVRRGAERDRILCRCPHNLWLHFMVSRGLIRWREGILC